MANSYIAIDEPAVTDKKLDTEQLTVGANTVERERVQIAGAAAAEIAPVSATDGLLVNLGSNNDVTVSGVATEAKQDTQVTALQAIQTAVELLDDVVKAEDAASANGDKGLVVVAKRSDTPGATSGTDGDYEPLQVTGGRLAVQATVSGTVTVDGSGVTQPVSHAALTELAAAIDTEVQVDVVGALPAGDNNIGNVDLASAIPAGTNLIGKVSASPETSTIYDGTTALTPKFAIIDAATSGDNTLLSAVVGKKIRVLALFLVAAGTVNVRFESGAGGTALTGQMNLIANTGFVLPFNPAGWFETASNTLLNLELSGAVSVDGSLVYVEV